MKQYLITVKFNVEVRADKKIIIRLCGEESESKKFDLNECILPAHPGMAIYDDIRNGGRIPLMVPLDYGNIKTVEYFPSESSFLHNPIYEMAIQGENSIETKPLIRCVD